MKKGALSVRMITLLLILVIAIIPTIGAFTKLLLVTEKVPRDIVECQQSALASLQVGESINNMRGIAKTVGLDLVDLPFLCPVTFLNVTPKTLSKKLSWSERREYTKLEYKSEKEYNLDKAVWGQTKSCYQKMFYGQSPLFERNLLASDKTICVVCSIIDFEPEVQKEFTGVQGIHEMILNKSVSVSNEKSLNELAQDHPEISGAMIQGQYTIDTRKAILYVRTNKAIFSEEITKIANLGTDIGNFGRGIVGYVTEGEFQKRYPRSNPPKDMEAILFIDYDNVNVLKDNCDELAAELEREQI